MQPGEWPVGSVAATDGELKQVQYVCEMRYGRVRREYPLKDERQLLDNSQSAAIAELDSSQHVDQCIPPRASA